MPDTKNINDTKSLKKDKTTKRMDTVAPRLTLNMEEKIYLAVCQKTSPNMLYMVYALVVRRDAKSNAYRFFAEAEVTTFADSKSAFVYTETLREIAEYQKRSMAGIITGLRIANAEKIKSFYESTR